VKRVALFFTLEFLYSSKKYAFKRQNRIEITGRQENVVEFSEKFVSGCEELGQNGKYICIYVHTENTHRFLVDHYVTFNTQLPVL